MKKLLLVIIIAVCSQFTYAQSACQAHFNYTESALTVSFVDSSYGSTTATNWTWNFGDGTTSNMQNPTHTYLQAGTYIVCLSAYTPFTNCQSTYCDSIVVGNSGNCFAGFTFAVDTLNPNKVMFADSSSVGIVNWQWDFGDATTANTQNSLHIYANSGYYSVCLTTTDAQGCTSTYCDSVMIGDTNATCSASFNYTLDFIDPKTILFYDNSSPAAASVFWDFNDGITSTLQNPVHIFNQVGLYMVCLTMSDDNGCSNTVCQQVSVGPVSCSSNYTFAPDTSNLQTIHFTDVSFSGTTGWLWDFGDGDSSMVQHPTHTFSSNGSYNVCLTTYDSTSNCVDTYCKTVEVSSCYAKFTTVADTANPLVIHFEDNSLGSPNNWHWDFEDGTSSNLQNPTHAYGFEAWRWVCLTSSNTQNNCSSTYCEFVYAGTPSSCYEYWEFTVDTANALTIHFQEYSWGSAPENFVWSFGDGDSSTVQNPTHTYDTAGVYFVCCYISDSAGACSYSDCFYLNVGNFSYCPSSFSHSMIADEIVSFSYNGSGAPTNYLWDFGTFGTSTQANPINDFQTPGTYYVCLTVSDSTCTNTYCDSVTITSVGMEDVLLENSISVYPNPAKGNFYVKLDAANTGVVTVTIFNPLGELVEERVMKTNNEMLDLSDKPSGLYSVKVQNNKSIVYKKIMIAK
ncbi:MAG: PKD domain-containing protein [Bacteroidia bacterium]